MCSLVSECKGYFVKRLFSRERLSEFAQILWQPLKTRRLLFQRGSQARDVVRDRYEIATQLKPLPPNGNSAVCEKTKV